MAQKHAMTLYTVDAMTLYTVDCLIFADLLYHQFHEYAVMQHMSRNSVVMSQSLCFSVV